MKGATVGLSLVILCCAIIGAVFSCNKSSHDPLYVGAILMLTGDSASYGIAIRDGMELATERVNKEGGIKGANLKIIFEDDQADPKEGVAAAQKLISVHHVPAIIGAVASGVTLAIAPLAEREGVILLSPASSSPAITTAGEYIFRNYPSDDLEGEAVAELAASNNCQTAAVLTINNEYGNGLNRVFTRSYTNRGGRLVASDIFMEGTRNFRSMLAGVKNAAPECIFVVGYAKELGTLIRQARDLGVNAQFYSTVNFFDSQTIEVGGRAVEGAIFSSPVFDPSSSNPEVKAFVANFEKRFKRQPDVWSAHGYDAVLLVAKAMKEGGTTPDEIKAGLYKIKDFPGVAGVTSFDANGDVRKPTRFLTVRDGQFVPFSG